MNDPNSDLFEALHAIREETRTAGVDTADLVQQDEEDDTEPDVAKHDEEPEE